MSNNLRQAAQQALEALEWAWGGEPMGTLERDAIAALRAALAEPEQEPQHDYRTRYDRGCYKCGSHYCPADCPEPAHLVPRLTEQPVAWQSQEHGDTEWVDCGKDAYGVNPRRYAYRALYTAPTPRRPLTDEEIEELCWTEMDRRLLSFARAIEAAHGIKE